MMLALESCPPPSPHGPSFMGEAENPEGSKSKASPLTLCFSFK